MDVQQHGSVQGDLQTNSGKQGLLQGRPNMETTVADTKPAADLESHLRGMILNSSSRHRGPSPSPTTSYSPVVPGRGGARRPNQSQRRQQAQQLDLTSHYPPTHPNPGYDMTNTLHRQQHPMTTPPRSFPTPPYPQQQYSYHCSRNWQPYDSQMRVPNAQSNRPRPPQMQQRRGNVEELNYISQLAASEIPKIEIDANDFAEKRALRRRLEIVCQDAISKCEREKNNVFPAETIELKSFGSLEIGFATKDSDMDLVLVSPRSKPDLSSSESCIPRLVEKVLMEFGFGARLLTQTRVPIIKFCEKPSATLAAHLHMNRSLWERQRGINGTISEENVREASQTFSSRASQSDEHDKESSISMLAQGTDQVSSVRSQTTSSCKTHQDNSVDSEEVEARIDGGNVARVAQSLQDDASEVPRSEDTPKFQTEINSAKISSSNTCKNNLAFSGYSDREILGLCLLALRDDSNFKDRSIEKDRVSTFISVFESDDPQSALVLPAVREALMTLPHVFQYLHVPTREDLDFPKLGVGTQCDINFSNELALHNSLLLKCYALCDPRVRPMVLFIKAWTKRRKINSPYHGTLNSYGYVLMVLHYLLNIAQPPVLQNLQLAHWLIEQDQTSRDQTAFAGHNIRFFRNEDKIMHLAKTGGVTQNVESLGSLLCGFFRFYAYPRGFSWKDDVLSLRTPGGVLTKAAKNWTGARSETLGDKKVNHHYVVSIEDPFEIQHNVARTVVYNGIVAIRDEFRRATHLIQNAGCNASGVREDFFAEGKKNENLQHRNGPPRKSNGPQRSQRKEDGKEEEQDNPQLEAGKPIKIAQAQ